MEILDLRKQGWSLEKIGLMQEPKMSKERVRVIIVTYLRSLVTPDLEEVRKLELERLDELQTAHWQRAMNGGAFATQQVLAIMGKRAALLGLNAPEKIRATSRSRPPVPRLPRSGQAEQDGGTDEADSRASRRAAGDRA